MSLLLLFAGTGRRRHKIKRYEPDTYLEEEDEEILEFIMTVVNARILDETDQ
jgi:hypothetical protein